MTGNALALKSRPSAIDWSQASIMTVAGVAALAIVGLLLTIVWMSLRTGVPGQPSPFTLNNYTSLL
ncbi:MAG TPA: hypothetical protein VI585_18130, partial [Candidatus Binatia bacterium]